MAKVLTIKDDIYKRLKKLKKREGMSFSEVINFLLNFYESHRESSSIAAYAGALKNKAIYMSRLRRLRREL